MPPLTGRINDRSRHEGAVVISHSFDNREESIYGLLDSKNVRFREVLSNCLLTI